MVGFIILLVLGFPAVSIGMFMVGLYASSRNLPLFSVHGSTIQYISEWFVLTGLSAVQLAFITRVIRHATHHSFPDRK